MDLHTLLWLEVTWEYISRNVGSMWKCDHRICITYTHKRIKIFSMQHICCYGLKRNDSMTCRLLRFVYYCTSHTYRSLSVWHVWYPFSFHIFSTIFRSLQNSYKNSQRFIYSTAQYGSISITFQRKEKVKKNMLTWNKSNDDSYQCHNLNVCVTNSYYHT